MRLLISGIVLACLIGAWWLGGRGVDDVTKAQVAPQQVENSNETYVVTHNIISSDNLLGLAATIVLLPILALLWLPKLRPHHLKAKHVMPLLLVGVGLPFLFYGLFRSGEIFNFLVLILDGVVLSFIFAGLAFWIALRFENRIRGFGLAVVVWLFFAVIYDGIVLLLLMYFREYPLENVSLVASLLNPIDLSRILILLKLDISALMGYTGAVFQKFFGNSLGMALTVTSLALWILLPAWGIKQLAVRKDF